MKITFEGTLEQITKEMWGFLTSQTESETQEQEGLESDVISLLRARQFINAIKLYRERTGSTLSVAKRAVEKIGDKAGLRVNGKWFWY